MSYEYAQPIPRGKPGWLPYSMISPSAELGQQRLKVKTAALQKDQSHSLGWEPILNHPHPLALPHPLVMLNSTQQFEKGRLSGTQQTRVFVVRPFKEGTM